MLQREHFAILWTFIKQPFVIKIEFLSIFKWLFKTGFSVLSGHSKRRPKLGFLRQIIAFKMQVKSIAECSKGGILQYFRPSLTYLLPLKLDFCLFLSGRLTAGTQCHLFITLCLASIGMDLVISESCYKGTIL